MTLTETLRASRLAGAERSAGGTTVLIHRSRQGYHLTRYTPDAQTQCIVYCTSYLHRQVG